ncbi:carbohydrate-binding module family 13 protein [Rhizophagus clarus]|uniref:Carbohydrate-binding module family 13 protein n=1 Tax=Rhizophagus clarus TaxID=94130 RepID=A0A8H3M493_9GLOM|nr:carbohydrate-binding module family 13 protein [Rhizophagus clarus]
MDEISVSDQTSGSIAIRITQDDHNDHNDPQILHENKYYDIVIEVGNDPQIKKFRAHTLILNYRSPYFHEILSTDEKKNNESLSHIKLPNISPEIFQIILRYIYGGRLYLGDCNNSRDTIKILVAANELKLKGLVNHLQSSLIENNANWLEQNFNFVYQTSFEDDSFSELRKYCNDLLSKEPDKLFNSLSFTSISENVLISLIQSDNIRMRETQVWEYVLKWSFAQNPDLPSDLTKFSKNDFITLKNTLQYCIPFIRFYNFTSKEFSDKVLPYKKILPKELYMDLLITFLNLSPNARSGGKLKPRTELIDSNIITSQHVELISKWVDRLDITDKSASSYKFILMLRESRDEPFVSKFHEVCNNQCRTVTIAKVKGRDKILGGYNPVEWKSDGGYSSSKDSFIFSFEGSSTENYILSRVVNEDAAIWNGRDYGPYFGSYDLSFYGSSYNFSRRRVYEKPIIDTEDLFSVEECEIFQITKNNID